jgi:cell division protein FtsI/penicillin-binding protein 2
MIRLVALGCAVAVVVVSAVTGFISSEPSVTASAKQFLVAWQGGYYRAAAAQTTGNQVVVARSLKAAYSQLGAEDLSLSMGPITVHGNTAHAYFFASIDLGRGGQPWNYRGSFTLRRSGSQWLVVWSPSVIAPGLGPNERLAVLTTLPQRAPLLDSAGTSLIPLSPTFEVGVIPDKVKDPTVTAKDLSRVARLGASDADEMRGQIRSAPPDAFFELLQLSPSQYAGISGRLAKVPGLITHEVSKRLFGSTVPELTGTVGTETARVLVEDGDAYLPGTTIGLSGLQQAFQPNLTGTPSTEVVVQNMAGHQIRVLRRWNGRAGQAVRTTINGGVQAAARNAVGSLGLPATIVAVKAGTGQVLAVASHSEPGMPAVQPLIRTYQPGQAFSIVSTAALLAAEPSFTARAQIPCRPTNLVNGQTFANVPAVPGITRKPFSVDFAHACSTALAGLSLDVSPSQLTGAANAFGLGVPWQLPVGAVTGSVKAPSSVNSPDLPADMTGRGTVEVSPLDMALVAAAVESGAWHQPSLVTSPTARVTPKTALKAKIISVLRGLMADTVKSGVARAARVRGAQLYGQVGSAPLPGHRGISAIWFVGYRGGVAFAVLVFSRSNVFDPAVSIAHSFVQGLRSGA